MLEETPRAATGAAIIDLHSIRAGLASDHAALDQVEAVRRQRVGQLAVGDLLRDKASGALGRVVRTDGGRVFTQFAGCIHSARRDQIAAGAALVELPSDCEAAS